jgi:hypothetical protein
MPFTSPEISLFFYHFLFQYLLIDPSQLLQASPLSFIGSLFISWLLIHQHASFPLILAFHFTIYGRYKLQSSIARQHHDGGN